MHFEENKEKEVKVEEPRVTYKHQSPHRKAGRYMRNDPHKNVTWLTYMIESKEYNAVACAAAACIWFNFELNEIRNGTEAVFWSIMDCPYGIVAVDIFIQFETDDGHANMLIVNKNVVPWEFERFEPHGAVEPNGSSLYLMQDLLDEALEQWIVGMFEGMNVVYKRPVDVCPDVGPQTRSENDRELNGFCQTWVWFYVEARLNNPNLKGEEILNDLFNADPRDLYEMIQDYVHMVATTTIPQEFYELQRIKLIAVTNFELFMRKIRTTEIDVGILNQLSHTLYTLLANARTKDTFQALRYFFRNIQCLENHPEYLRDVFIAVHSLTGRTLFSSDKIDDIGLKWFFEPSPEALDYYIRALLGG